jgi:hypothetical protein
MIAVDTDKEKELRQKIAVKQREQYLATRDIINKAESRVRDTDRQLKIGDPSYSTKLRLKNDLDMYRRNRDIIYGIADRNRRIYEYEIDCIHDEIKLLYETDCESIRLIKAASQRKTAYYELIGIYTATIHDVWRHIYERIPTPTGEYQMGLLERTKTHMSNIEYEKDNLRKMYRRLLYLFDLGLKDYIMDFYRLAETLPKEGAIAEFVDRCKTTYLIPDQIRRFEWRARTLKHLPLCDDVICEIFSFLHSGRLCDRKMIDSLVYQETYGF